MISMLQWSPCRRLWGRLRKQQSRGTGLSARASKGSSRSTQELTHTSECRRVRDSTYDPPSFLGHFQRVSWTLNKCRAKTTLTSKLTSPRRLSPRASSWIPPVPPILQLLQNPSPSPSGSLPHKKRSMRLGQHPATTI